MDRREYEFACKRIGFVTNVSVAVNVGLFILKVAVGAVGGSMALVADGIHSLSDMATDLAVLLGHHFGSKEPDVEHPYGHGRLETFAAGFVALFLILVGSAMIYYAAIDIAKGNTGKASGAVLVAASISVVVKELLYRLTKRVAVECHSSMLYANAWHQRSDALSSVAVIVGVVALRFGFGYGDQIAAIGVGLMIILVGARIMGDCLSELAERALDEDTIEHVKSIINADSSIRQWHKLRSRAVGREIFLDLHILVDPALNVASAHEISANLEKALADQLTRPVNITVHIEPDLPELREPAPAS
jgi:cation diffusion facilitator family transporter